MPDRIIKGIRASIDQHQDIFELVPDSPIPFRGFVKALAHLIKLRAANYIDSRCLYYRNQPLQTIIEAKGTALRFMQEIGDSLNNHAAGPR